jgi:DNA-binding LacI/PurR family transcriptional regulator
MNQARLPLEPEPSVDAPLDESGGFKVTMELLERDPPPTAIVVATARWALGALAACHEAGFAVPEDVSVVAFSDLPIAQYMRPALTTVQLPLIEMGTRAVDMLLTLVDGGAVSDVMLDVPVRLTPRASTGPPSAD